MNEDYSRGLWFSLEDEETSDYQPSHVWVLFLIAFLLVIMTAFQTPLMP